MTCHREAGLLMAPGLFSRLSGVVFSVFFSNWCTMLAYAPEGSKLTSNEADALHLIAKLASPFYGTDCIELSYNSPTALHCLVALRLLEFRAGKSRDKHRLVMSHRHISCSKTAWLPSVSLRPAGRVVRPGHYANNCCNGDLV